MIGPMKISKRTVDALKPTGKRFTVMDADLKGFCVRVSASGVKSYGFRYRVGGGRAGRDRWLTIGAHGKVTADQAREIAKSWAADVAKGGDPAKDRDETRTAPTMSEFLDRYLEDHVRKHNKPRTQAEVERQVEAVVRPALGKIKVREVERSDIAKLHAGMSSTPYAANRALALLSKAFELAEVWGYRPDSSNPCRNVTRYAERRRERFLSGSEFAALGRVLAQAEAGPLALGGRKRSVRVNPQAVLAIRLLIFTGARISEVLALRWEWINWDAQRAELPDSKTGAKHLVLPAPALEILRGLDRPTDGKGFVVRGGRRGDDPSVPLVNVKGPWAAIREAADLDGVRLHDLRHSFASVAASGGMSLPVIGSLLGHRNTATTARYAHLADDPRQAAAAKIAGEIEAAMEGGKSGAEVIDLRKKR